MTPDDGTLASGSTAKGRVLYAMYEARFGRKEQVMPVQKFDAAKAVADLDAWLIKEGASPEERARHCGVLNARVTAARKLDEAAALITEAYTLVETADGLRQPLRALEEVARDLRDYDPSGD